MTGRIIILILAACVAGCASHQGLYEPACMAFAGETIELRDDEFRWQRFTDEVGVDDNGNLIDPFPGFPKSGGYTVSNATVQLHPSDDSDSVTRHLHKQHDGVYLLTPEQHAAVVGGADMPDCALRQKPAKTDAAGT